MRFVTRCAVAALATVLLTGGAFAAKNDVYGNVSLGVETSFNFLGDETVILPSVHVGGKFSYEPSQSPFGLQLDADYGLTEFDWISPNVGAEGNIQDFVGVLHATYAMNDGLKLGSYLGFERFSIGLDSIDPDALNDSTVEADAAVNIWQAGVEALMSFDDANSLQMRVGISNPYSIKLSARDSTGTESESFNDSDNDIFALQAGLSHRMGVTQNVSFRTDVNYTEVITSDAPNIGVLNFLGTMTYAFDTMPLALSAAGGYGIVFADGESEDAWLAKAKLSWSFGGEPNGVRGKLFRSVNFVGDAR